MTVREAAAPEVLELGWVGEQGQLGEKEGHAAAGHIVGKGLKGFWDEEEEEEVAWEKTYWHSHRPCLEEMPASSQTSCCCHKKEQKNSHDDTSWNYIHNL